MKARLFFAIAVLILAIALLPSCSWQNAHFTDASRDSVTENTVESRTADTVAEEALESVTRKFDNSIDYDYANLYYDPTDVYNYENLTDAQSVSYKMLAYAVDCIIAGDIGDITAWELESDIMILNDDAESAKELFCANYHVLKNIVDMIDIDCRIVKKQTVLTYENNDKARRELQMYFSCLDKADAIFKQIDKTAPQEDIAYAIARQVSDGSEYDAEYMAANSVYGMLADGRGICEAFAYTYDFLCKKAGLYTITSTVTRGDFHHVWCMINLDGEWYNVDTTWMTTMNDGGDYFLFDDGLRSRYQRAKIEQTCYYYDHSKGKAVFAPISVDASKNQ